MDVIFRFEKHKAQIILQPTDAMDESSLNNIRTFWDKNVRFKLGSARELIIEADSRETHEKDKKPAQPAKDPVP